jgi:Fe-S cluster assembly protein SufD
MTVQVLKTRAETGLTEEFAAVEDRLPGGEWLKRLRREAIGAFSAHGLPHRRIEEWKYTDLRAAIKEAFPLAAGEEPQDCARLLDAALGAALSGPLFRKNWVLFADGRGIGCGGVPKVAQGGKPYLARLAESPPAWLKTEIERAARPPTDALMALNSAFFTDGAVLDIADGAEIDAPIVMVFADGAEDEEPRRGRSAFVRNVIRVGKGAKALLIECYVGGRTGPRQSNAVTQLVLGEGADVAHVVYVDNKQGSVHLGRQLVALGREASFRPFAFTIASGLVRSELWATFGGEGGALDFAGTFLTDGDGHADTTLVVDHRAPGCRSRELMKGVLDGRSRGVFQGKVIVRPGAQKTDGKQMAQALMLSPDAEFDSKPELEIFADDVVCGHGSTSAELDDDLLFYCRTRGIPLEEARALLVESFIGEAFDRIEHESVRGALMGLARQWLAAGRMKSKAA